MTRFENQTLVVPFDFSPPSINALRQVHEWADDSNVIHMIYVVAPTPTMIDLNVPVLVPPNLVDETRLSMLAKMQDEYGNAKVKHHCVVGDPGRMIVELANEEEADMIVMPSHGRFGISRFLLGSVAERVLRLAQCPVLVLRGKQFESDNEPSESRD